MLGQGTLAYIYVPYNSHNFEREHTGLLQLVPKRT
jgi:hypothetical protein